VKVTVEYEEKRPTQIKDPDLTTLRATLKEYMDAVEGVKSGGYVDEDFTHYIEEETLKAFYGPDVYDYIDERLR